MSSRRTGTEPQGQGQPRPTTTAEGTEEKPKMNFDKLLEKLVSRGIALVEFAHVQENRRKRMLQDDYQDIKNETGWMYDEPIDAPKEAYEKENELKDRKREELEAKTKK